MAKYDQIKSVYEERILAGMARALWVYALLTFEGENLETPRGRRRLRIPRTPEAALEAAVDLEEVFADGEELGGGEFPMADFFELYMAAKWGEPFQFMNEQDANEWAAARDRPPAHDQADDMGFDIANGALGPKSGASHSFAENAKLLGLDVVMPHFDIQYDGKDLSWVGKPGTPQPRRNSPGNAAPGNAASGASGGGHELQVRARLADRTTDMLCDEGCPGWAVFDTDRGWEIQACDDCNAGARRAGLATVTDEEVALLPEAQQELAAMEAEYPVENGGHDQTSADQVWRVEVIDRQGPFMYRTRGTYDDVKAEAEADATVVSITPDRWRRNPRGLTRKGERMYKAIEKGYRAVGEARAKEIASRTVLSRAKQGGRGLIKKPAAGRR